MLFDLVAMAEGGIAQVTRIVETERDVAETAIQADGRFVLSDALASLLKINLSGRGSRTKTDGSERSTTEERIHTPASLLQRLLSQIEVRDLDAAAGIVPAPGDLVRFTGTLSRNPLLEVISVFVELMDLATVFQEDPRDSAARKQAKQFDSYKKQAARLLDALKQGNTIDLTSRVGGSLSAVVTLETAYLNTPDMSDLVDGTLTIVGKVTQYIPDASSSINLLRKTPFARMPPGILEQASTALMSMGQEGWDLPRAESRIPGPAFQVLPVAIFA
jgi:hypothetical protein